MNRNSSSRSNLEDKEKYFADTKGNTASIQNTNQANIDLQDDFYNDKGGNGTAPTYLAQVSTPAIKVTKE